MDETSEKTLTTLDKEVPNQRAWLVIGIIVALITIVVLVVVSKGSTPDEVPIVPPDPKQEAARVEYERVTNERGTVTEDDIAQSEASLEQAVESRGKITEEARDASRLEYERLLEAQAQ